MQLFAFRSKHYVTHWGRSMALLTPPRTNIHGHAGGARDRAAFSCVIRPGGIELSQGESWGGATGRVVLGSSMLGCRGKVQREGDVTRLIVEHLRDLMLIGALAKTMRQLRPRPAHRTLKL